MPDTVAQIVTQLTIWALPALLAITLHEAAHGFAAYRLGDDTAKRAGRLTLNPLAHVDPVGTILLPGLLMVAYFLGAGGILFGYAKPVPVDYRRFKNPRDDMAWVALAGPAMNIALALLSVLLITVLMPIGGAFASWAVNMLRVSVFFNCLIAVFNMLPIPPLDGSRVLAALLPPRWAWHYTRLDRYGFLIVLGLFFLPPLLSDWNPFITLVFKPTLALTRWFASLSGVPIG
ncbi:Zn-dependent protease [Rhodothalassium salexigens DSM 2132]|uniref:Zn-dependent protease n=1 Tax=Rhodothalassium salexigens DSM 2132 TaxID=1188247 RepID=A0A4R2PTZ8_RHOSA|nr:site-2 protease family protein [Rhodothalassium salexigens]MBB4210344.1 Zn-dependent protease [Rhodothalassium salexigens DSM 2132]MBK1638885.1 hypothetical protein [Rhodothalassium salexigens DSM 2132]TCP38508.1 Zn-dependent protease [Rhodothalassium salexigens DSM 2132]